MLTYGSLFAGIGGFDLGLERAGMRGLWQCEIHPYAQRVLEKHWPDVLRVPDIRGVGADTVPYVDVICGGFPCQDLSYAGKGAGLDGARSGLWSEYARVVGELRPRYVIVENVSALLARGVGRVLGDLAALGYDAEWDCLPASAVGAPHQRDRVWLVAYPNGDDGREGRPGRSDPGCAGQSESVRALQDPDADRGRLEVGAQLDGEQEQAAANGHTRRRHADGLGHEVADTASSGLEGSGVRGRLADRGAQLADPQDVGYERAGASRDGRAGPADGSGRDLSEWWAVEPGMGRVAHGVPQRVDRLRALGNALVPQIAEWIGRRILEHEGMTA